ncbi:MAG: hypothetical protein AAB428_02885 [Patescibacteria group bacterium]|mgnify:CR=1 FL=1
MPRFKAKGGGAIQKKIMLLLLSGLALGLTRSPNKYFRILKLARREWREIDRRSLNQAIKSLYESRLVKTKSNKDGTFTLILSDMGKTVALTYDIDSMTISKPQHWDGNWRIVLFDIPERLKKIRDSVRHHLKNLKFFEFQKSVFVHPFPCEKEIEYIVEFYNIRKHVRFITAHNIDNELHLKKNFGLL